MDKSALELHKNTGGVNEMDWVKNLLVAEYGDIVQVIDVNTVRVRRVVQDSSAAKYYTVRLLHTSSMALEESIEPQKGDQVLLLFLRAHNDSMFLSAADRKKLLGSEVIYDRDCNNFSMFSGVGLLAATAKGRAATIRSHSIGDDGPRVDEKTLARVRKIFNKAVSVAFDVPMTSASDDPDDEAVNVFFGPHSPLKVSSNGAITHDVGFDEKDNTVEFDSPVAVNIGSKSPVTISSKGALSITFAKASLVKMGDTFKLDITGGLTISSGADIVVSGSTIQLNGNSGYATEYTALASALSTFMTALNARFASKQDGGGAAGGLTLDISGAKKSTVKL